MKKNIIILFPTVAKLLLYASGVPIQQNCGNSFASPSVSSDIYPIDSSPAQRSDLDDVLNVLHPRASVKDLLNPEPQTPPNAPTSSASHGARGSANTLPPIHSILSHPDFIPANSGQFWSRYGAQSGPAPLALPPQYGTDSHQQYTPNSNLPSPLVGNYVPMDPSHSSGGPPFHTPLLPHHAGVQYQGSDQPFHGRKTNPEPETIQYKFVAYKPSISKPPQSPPATHNNNQHQHSSSAAVSVDPDRVPTHIPEGLDNLRPDKVADKLKRTDSKIRTPDEVVEEMLIMKTLFEKALEKMDLVSTENVLTAWVGSAMDLTNDEHVTEPKSEGLEWWRKMIGIQMRAIAKLHEGQGLQPQFDHYWIDDETSFTTRLLKERESTRYLGVMHITKGSLQRTDLQTLERTDNTSEALLEMAQRQVVSSPTADERIKGALVLRRKAIQMWMLKGMTEVEFAKQKGILREIVANLDERDFNKVRAEMVIISLQRFIRAKRIEWKEA